jgi:hypothetical protein
MGYQATQELVRQTELRAGMQLQVGCVSLRSRFWSASIGARIERPYPHAEQGAAADGGRDLGLAEFLVAQRGRRG